LRMANARGFHRVRDERSGKTRSNVDFEVRQKYMAALDNTTRRIGIVVGTLSAKMVAWT
jgi:hypothetical protein